jgi:Ca2+-binding RTX toxin-like protein
MAPISGTQGKDNLRGTAGDDTFAGSDGADSFQGGPGVDTVTYTWAQNPTGVKVDLSTGTGHWGFAEGDTYFGIENVTGTSNKDWLIGDNGNNTLDGWFGNDVLDGRGGDDIIIGGGGDDIITGGSGSDTLTVWGKDVVTDFQVGVDRLSFHQTMDELNLAQVGSDTVITVDGFRSSDVMITLQNVNLNQLMANQAHDFLFV